MTTRSVVHGSFAIEREYDVPRERVFAAWADRDAKNEWFGEGDTDFNPVTDTYELDFKVGGVELLDGLLPSGKTFTFRAVYGDIVDNERIVMSYDVLVDGARISVSLMTVEFFETATGTRLLTTEQGAFFDGLDTNEKRIVGATHSVDMMGAYLARHEVPVATAI